MIKRGNMQNVSKNRAVVFPEWPQWDEHERNNLMRALQNRNWGTLGPMAMEFARRFAEYVGAAHAIPVNSGTQAMQILLGGAGIGFGDEVVVPAYACPPTAAAVALTGAVPVFVDVCPDTGLIDPAKIEAAITYDLAARIPFIE